MICDRVSMPGGGTAIVCSSGRRKRCKCGRDAFLLCDWRMPEKRSGTCDAPICNICGISPAPGKDLCAKHKAEFLQWQAEKREQRRG